MVILSLFAATVFFGIVLTGLSARSRKLCGAIGVSDRRRYDGHFSFSWPFGSSSSGPEAFQSPFSPFLRWAQVSPLE